MKFKKKSQIGGDNLNNILENKARISINTKTGKHEFTYGQVDKHAENYLQNSDSLVKFHDTSGNEPVGVLRPSKLLWQLPYEERKGFMEN